MINTQKLKIVVASMALIPMGLARADVNSDMQAMFDSLGVMGNYSSPTSFTAQGRGYLVGGGVSVRAPVQSLTPISFQRPSFAAGCGGIDMHLGSISFANLDAYKNFFQALPSQALGYGLKVGLDAISPTLRKAFDSVEDIVNRVNAYAMNSCQAAQFAVNGAMGLIDQGNLERCKQRKLAEGAKDAAEAEITCKGSGAEVAEGGAGAPESLRPINGNMVWKALAKLEGLDNEDREFMMSLFGTVVVQPGRTDPYPPTIPTFKEFFQGQSDPANPSSASVGLNVYRCDTTSECLRPTKRFAAVATFPGRVEERMLDIARRLLTQQPQSSRNIGFINGTQFPVFRMLVLATATGDESMAKSFVTEYKDVIAVELARMYIDKVVSQATSVIRMSQPSRSTAEEQLLRNIVQTGNEFRQAASDYEATLSGKAVARNALKNNLESLQQRIYGDVPDNVRRLMATLR